MFKVGDVVDIVYTGKEYCGGISFRAVKEYMKGNPYTIIKTSPRSPDTTWHKLEGIPYSWIGDLLDFSYYNNTPDWEV